LPSCSSNSPRPVLREPASEVYALGERWEPEGDGPDKIFGFSPDNGVHDIHMNQGLLANR
jgi:uncharacterized protein YukJ